MSLFELGIGFGHWQHFHIGTFLSLFRPQRLTQVASRHARVTLASMWLRRAMPYATIDPRVGRMDLRQKRLWRSRHGRRRSHIGFDAAFASGQRPVAFVPAAAPCGADATKRVPPYLSTFDFPGFSHAAERPSQSAGGGHRPCGRSDDA